MLRSAKRAICKLLLMARWSHSIRCAGLLPDGDLLWSPIARIRRNVYGDRRRDETLRPLGYPLRRIGGHTHLDWEVYVMVPVSLQRVGGRPRRGLADP